MDWVRVTSVIWERARGRKGLRVFPSRDTFARCRAATRRSAPAIFSRVPTPGRRVTIIRRRAVIIFTRGNFIRTRVATIFTRVNFVRTRVAMILTQGIIIPTRVNFIPTCVEIIPTHVNFIGARVEIIFTHVKTVPTHVKIIFTHHFMAKTGRKCRKSAVFPS